MDSTNSEAQQSPLEETMIKSSEPSNSLPRVPLSTSGYGHFHFNGVSAEDRDDPDFLVSSNNAPFVELDGFERIGSFPYMKLPIEVRHMVLGYLVAPFIDDGNGFINVELYGTSSCHADHTFLTNKAEENIEKRAEEEESALAKGIASYLSTREERRKNDDRRSKELEASWDNFNKQGYLMSIFAPKKTSEIESDSAMLDSIRHLSQVSTNFRKELGDVFWARTRIVVAIEEFYDGVLGNFLKERTAVHKGIRALDFDIEFWDEDHPYQKEFNATFKQVKKLKAVEHIQFEIMICESQLPDLAAGSGVFKKLSMLQDVKVAKGITFGLCMMSDDHTLYEEDRLEEEYEYLKGVSAIHMPAIRKFITPKTLRAKGLNKNVKLRLRAACGDYHDE